MKIDLLRTASLFVPGFKPTRFDLVAGSPTLEESYLSKKGDGPRTDQLRKGADSNLPGWQPKEKEA